MCQHLPVGGFKWLTQNGTDGLDMNAIRKYNPGCTFGVDLEYTKAYHDLQTMIIL